MADNSANTIANACSTTAAVSNELRRMLVERQRVLLDDIHGTMRSVRADATLHEHHAPGRDEADDASLTDDLTFALMQMKTESLLRITEALQRLDEGAYGQCIDCEEAISTSRLRALPFASRCKDCEESRENAELQQRSHARRGASPFGLTLRH